MVQSGVLEAVEGLGMGGVGVRGVLGVRCGGVLGDGRGGAEGRLPLTPTKAAPPPKTKRYTSPPQHPPNTPNPDKSLTKPTQNPSPPTHHPPHK